MLDPHYWRCSLHNNKFTGTIQAVRHPIESILLLLGISIGTMYSVDYIAVTTEYFGFAAFLTSVLFHVEHANQIFIQWI